MSIKSTDKALDKGHTRSRVNMNWMLPALLIGLSILLYGSVKMAYIAFNSQPECVPHLKASGDDDKVFIAAKSSC